MDFRTALKRLGIEDFADRIMHSSSTGELFHLQDYIVMAEKFSPEICTGFREQCFLKIVHQAEKTWKRPESVFQHILKLITQD